MSFFMYLHNHPLKHPSKINQALQIVQNVQLKQYYARFQVVYNVNPFIYIFRYMYMRVANVTKIELHVLTLYHVYMT